jgi:hypothetical protein
MWKFYRLTISSSASTGSIADRFNDRETFSKLLWRQEGMNHARHPRICSIFLAGLIMALLSVLARPVLAHSEDRVLLAANVSAGEYLLTVWTAPARLRVGEIHVESAVFDRNGNPDEQCVVQVALTPLDRTGSPLTVLSLPVAGAEAGLRSSSLSRAATG